MQPINRAGALKMTTSSIFSVEYNATEMRELLVQLFPYRRLVLSQFTFFSNEGMVEATGQTLRRGRRCYRITDILPMVCIFALKERGIPLKNIKELPQAIRENIDLIFNREHQARIFGYGNSVSLLFDQDCRSSEELKCFLSDNNSHNLYWMYNLSELAANLLRVAEGQEQKMEVAA